MSVKIDRRTWMRPQNRGRGHWADFTIEAGLDRMRLPSIGHDSEYFLRLHNLPHGHRDSLRWHRRKIFEPSFSHLLEPASFVEVDHDERLFGFEIRWWIVES